MANLCVFLRPVFSASHVQHVSDMHSKFALRPHHVWKYDRHPICDHREQARNKEEEITAVKHNGLPLLCKSGHNEQASSTSMMSIYVRPKANI